MQSKLAKQGGVDNGPPTLRMKSGKRGEQPTGYQDRPWIPRFWSGINMRGWFPLLVRHRFAVAPSRIPMTVLLSAFTVLNLLLWAFQQLLLGAKIRRTEIEEDPIFVIGHWRSGTTLLHELMVLDPRHTCPRTYDCFCPNHFLVSAWLFRLTLGWLLPSKRPMDNMTLGWDRPQEDEFALCNMGVPSPYLSWVFANHPPEFQEYYELADVPPGQLARWKRKVRWFLKCLTVREAKRIVLKSPPHTFRLKVLLEMFPNARFIHIVRNPYVLFPSTMKLWKRLSRDQGVQIPRYEGLEEEVFERLVRMYDAFERDRALIDPSRICDVRYEELVEDPIAQMRRVYDKLDLGAFDAALPALQQYVAEKKDYKTNRYEIAPEIRDEITRRWGGYLERYGYPVEG